MNMSVNPTKLNIVNADEFNAENARLKVRVSNLIAQVIDQQRALARRDREIADLRAELGKPIYSDT